jgi:glycosyltransferase involved in cell wall biosynthesis
MYTDTVRDETQVEDNVRREQILTQACWLIEHEMRIKNDASGWLCFASHPNGCGRDSESLWLSASVQGQALSTLVQAYRLTGDELYLETARRTLRTFERDILDGGISTPIGEHGVSFEEVAVYPASHKLNGLISALLGLHDYVALTDDQAIAALLQRSHATLHLLLNEFDVGYWTRTDLLHRQFSSPDHLMLQIALLEKLALQFGCEHCMERASCWRNYHRRMGSYLRYLITSRCIKLRSALLGKMRSSLFPKDSNPPIVRVCIPITAFPFMGGMRTVLAKVAQVTSDIWQIEYVTQNVGAGAEQHVVHRFGSKKMTPWQFPSVWLYYVAGLRRLILLIRQGKSYDILLPQDGIFTAAFTGLVGKLAGVRVVCIDHGNLMALDSPVYRTERLRYLAKKRWIRRFLERALLIGYWPSLRVLAWLAARLVDHFCIPGVAGDGVEEVCKRLGVGSSRLTRFVNTVDMENHTVLDAAPRMEMREKHGISADDIVITTICRLSPEKGLDIALGGIAHALSLLPYHLRTRVRFIIAGDGELRWQIEDDIRKRGLEQTCILWGEIPHEKVLLLYSLSDIYLYSGIRGGGYSLVMLEAMASGCATIASDVPLANEHMLADGRGIVVPAGDMKRTGIAIAQLVGNEKLRQDMGRLARNYVAQYNTAEIFRRVWVRTTYWSELHTLLDGRREVRVEK